MQSARRSSKPSSRARWVVVVAAVTVVGCKSGKSEPPLAEVARPLAPAFQPKVLVPPGEAPFNARFFTTPVKTNSRGEVITGLTSDPVKNIVGAEPAGEKGGLERYTKIMFANDYFDGRPDKGQRITPNNKVVQGGSHFWPFVPQPFRSYPNQLAVTPDGKKLYVTLPGKEGYPDWRVAVVDTSVRRVSSWVDLRPQGQALGTRPMGVAVSPLNAAIFPSPYVVVTQQYANFASVIDTRNDAVVGQFETGFYAEDVVFNAAGTRLYLTDRFKDQVRAFRVDPGPVFTQIAQIPTATTLLEGNNPRDLSLSADGRTLYVANTLGHTIAVINVAADANLLSRVMPLGGLATDVKIAGRWGIVSGHATNTRLNEKEGGHGLPRKNAQGTFIRNDGSPLGYLPVMGDATRATTFDDLGSELNIFDTATQQFVFRYVDFERDRSMMAVPGQIVDLGDHSTAQKIIRGSGPEQLFVRGDLLFVTQLHSDKVEVFRINQNPSGPQGILTPLGFEFTGGITPQGVAASPDGKTVYVANMQTEDVSFLGVDPNGALTRQGFLAVGVTPKTPDPTTGGQGAGLFATGEEIGLRWLFSSAYSDDGQKSCGFCHWQSRSDGSQWNVGANAIGGVKNCPQNKDISDNWPEWYEGLNNDMTAYASACNGELNIAERPTALFPQPNLVDRLHARNDFVLKKTLENSNAIGRSELHGAAKQTTYADMAFKQILWSQNETRRFPNPLLQFPSTAEAARLARGKFLFTAKVADGGAGCADCHHNGNVVTNGVVDDTFQDYNIYEPGVISDTTVDGSGPFTRLANDYFFEEFGAVQDEGSRQNISSRNVKHLRQFWDSTARWLHHGGAHTLKEILLAPDSPLLGENERGFNFRTVRTDHSRASSQDYLGAPPLVLPTEVPITFADSDGSFGGDGRGPLYVSLDSPRVTRPDGTLQIDRLGSDNLAPLVVLQNGIRVINPALAANNIQVIKDTHGKTSQLNAADIEALSTYLQSLQ
jgi:DNA-binding beta-propeller fold protein YncE